MWRARTEVRSLLPRLSDQELTLGANLSDKWPTNSIRKNTAANTDPRSRHAGREEQRPADQRETGAAPRQFIDLMQAIKQSMEQGRPNQKAPPLKRRERPYKKPASSALVQRPVNASGPNKFAEYHRASGVFLFQDIRRSCGAVWQDSEVAVFLYRPYRCFPALSARHPTPGRFLLDERGCNHYIKSKGCSMPYKGLKISRGKSASSAEPAGMTIR